MIDYFLSNFTDIVFYVSSFCALLCAIGVVFSKNPIQSLLFLILTFFLTAITWLIANAEFLAVSLIFVYIGAILVLFLFIMMILKINQNVQKTQGKIFKRYFSLMFFIIISIVMASIFVYVIQQFNLKQDLTFTSINLSNVEQIGKLLYKDYLLEIELAGVILLAAMVGAISLTFRKNIFPKTQDLNMQLKVTKKDRLKIVDID